jgi:hypothetical protein
MKGREPLPPRPRAEKNRRPLGLSPKKSGTAPTGSLVWFGLVSLFYFSLVHTCGS